MGTKSRPSSGSYVDPLDVIWTALAEELGLQIQRDDAAYASFDGAGTLTIGTDVDPYLPTKAVEPTDEVFVGPPYHRVFLAAFIDRLKFLGDREW